jgi:hypothetical protein
VYQTRKDTAYEIEDTEIDECPVSLISPESIQVVEAHGRARIANQSCGAQMYGPDLSRWPARDVDALVLIETERTKEHNARIEAEISEE